MYVCMYASADLQKFGVHLPNYFIAIFHIDRFHPEETGFEMSTKVYSLLKHLVALMIQRGKMGRQSP